MAQTEHRDLIWSEISSSGKIIKPVNKNTQAQSGCVPHTWHIDIDAAVLCIFSVVSTVEAGVVASVHRSGVVHSDGGDKQAAVVLLCYLRNIEWRLPD